MALGGSRPPFYCFSRGGGSYFSDHGSQFVCVRHPTSRACTAAALHFIFLSRAVLGHLLLLVNVTDGVILLRSSRQRAPGALRRVSVRPHARLLAVPIFPPFPPRRHAAHQSVRSLQASRHRSLSNAPWGICTDGANHLDVVRANFEPSSGPIASHSSPPSRLLHRVRYGVLRSRDSGATHSSLGRLVRLRRCLWKYIDVDRQPTEVNFCVFRWMTLRAPDFHAPFAHNFLPYCVWAGTLTRPSGLCICGAMLG